ncbi:MAG TPA: HNH endonuclease signature motif containing protein [Kofleriaceae bacterium]|nr:HNH endonuclease signature motif containing protein [Kofleriaceae bacterium]
MFEGATTVVAEAIEFTAAAAAAAVVETSAELVITDWREIDQRLRRVASAQAALEAEELRWLAVAQEIELHRQLGMASMLEYVERVLGHGPKAAHERLRVARELKELPLTRAALEQGRLSFSAVRELSRKVTAKTEGEWLELVRGKCLREIEDLLSGHRKGDRPADPIDPDLRLRKITLELTPPTMALFREACRRLEEEMGHHLTDDETMAAMCATVLGGATPRGDCDVAESPRGDASPIDASPIDASPIDGSRDQASRNATSRNPAPRVAPYQIALTVCPSCELGWHDAGGRAIAVPDSTIAQAICDAQYLGTTDLIIPARTYQEVSPATARLVLRRDRGCCRVPGCRSARWLQLHHIIWREHGGSNDPRNLLCLCFAHHQAVHQSKIGLTGEAPDRLAFDLSAYLPVGPPAA